LKGIIKKIGAIIALKKEGGQEEVPYIVCPNPKCLKNERGEHIEVQCKNAAQMQGIITCLNCNHEWPISIDNGHIKELGVALPISQSGKLSSGVYPDVKEDVKEAERCHYHRCYKACVTMCRRALQLSLIDKGMKDERLGKMLKDAHTVKKLLTDDTYTQAKSIKHFGDIGAHREETIEPEVARLVIFVTVQMLNEIFK
jgi:hypothetical protein